MSLRILYVAKHDSGGNDDEGAVTHALQSMGHNVQRVKEKVGSKAWRVSDVDLCLFHKWYDPLALQRIKCPKVFWYFDLVDCNDRTLSSRNAQRINWMRAILPLVDLGFCTDGDWVDRDQAGKLAWLPQGADERVVGRGTPSCPHCDQDYESAPILFTGICRGGGRKRESWCGEMERQYGPRFHRQDHGVYGRDLANLIAASKIVLAPDFPVSDRYYSNRVYNALGLGAFMLHPYSRFLADHYHDGDEIVFYHSRHDLHDKIEHYLSDHVARKRISESGLERTMREHLYRHRCEKLIEIVKERVL